VLGNLVFSGQKRLPSHIPDFVGLSFAEIEKDHVMHTPGQLYIQWLFRREFAILGRNVLELVTIHIQSSNNHIEILEVIPEPQHICEKHVSFALLVWCRMCLFPAGFLHILLIIFPGILKGWLPILSKHMLIH
jgi:hypothetical protein